jgi:hypothetical protein
MGHNCIFCGHGNGFQTPIQALGGVCTCPCHWKQVPDPAITRAHLNAVVVYFGAELAKIMKEVKKT